LASATFTQYLKTTNVRTQEASEYLKVGTIFGEEEPNARNQADEKMTQ
jgi:hypothetical protein